MFPVSVALAGFVVHRAGPAAFFAVAAATLSATLAWALSQQAFRDFGRQASPGGAESHPPAAHQPQRSPAPYRPVYRGHD